MSRYRQAHASAADLACDQFRRDMLEAKAPTTHRLLRAVDATLSGLPYGHPMLATLESLSISLSYDAERGAEHSAKSAEYVDGLLAQIKVTA